MEISRKKPVLKNRVAREIEEAIVTLNDRVIPFFDSHEIKLLRALTSLSNLKVPAPRVNVVDPMLRRGAEKRHELALPRILADEVLQLSPRLRLLLAELREEWRELDGRVEALIQEIEKAAKADPACRRLQTIPGVGPMIASALVAAIGDGSAFKRGRDLAAWLGIVPHQCSTGGKTRLLGISR